MKSSAMWSLYAVVAASLLMGVACSDPAEDGEAVTIEVGSDMAGATTSDDGMSTGGEQGADATADLAAPVDRFKDCPVAARPVYVVDAAGFKLLSFDPPTLSFKEVGSVAGCPSQVNGATPFSMAVDRDANAWVLYNSGELFIYEIENKRCMPTNFRPTQEFALFGMGFVLDWPNLQEDILYIAGDGSGPGDMNPSDLGRVNFVEPDYERIAGPLPGDPELTGTANGELWGFFPNTDPAQVARIDRVTGELHERFDIPQIDDQAAAWAFAFWGGDFWVFYTGAEDDSTRVIKVDPETNQSTEVLRDTGYLIVGAGVSTCAPLENG